MIAADVIPRKMNAMSDLEKRMMKEELRAEGENRGAFRLNILMFCSLHTALYTSQAAARPVGVHKTKISDRLDIQMKSAAGETTDHHDR